MGVKLIFKTILYTIIGIVGIGLTIEFINVAVNSPQISALTKISVREACDFFGQETYKREDVSFVGVEDLKDSDGNLFISGNFYGETSINPSNTSTERIYNNLYLNNNKLLNWYDSNNMANGRWKELDAIIGRLRESAVNPNTLESMVGQIYKEGYMTPLNLGITYLDKDTVEKIAKWNLASILSTGKKEVRLGNNGDKYVRFRGFKVYIDTLHITDIDYKIYDLSKSADASEFERLTNISINGLNFSDTGGAEAAKRVCIAGVSYKVEVAYEGITPIKNITEYIWNTSVEGLEQDEYDNKTAGMEFDTSQRGTLEAGGFGGTANGLPVPGRLIYYIIR